MSKIPVQSVDLFVHPFFKVSRNVGFNDPPLKERRFMKWLSGVWGKAILSSKRKKDNLFVLITYPLANDFARQQLETLERFASEKLGKRFIAINYSLAQQLRSGRFLPISLKDSSFRSFSFSKGKPIRINSWGETLGNCPLREANILKSALIGAGHKARVLQHTARCVDENASIKKNRRRMRKKNQTNKRRKPKPR